MKKNTFSLVTALLLSLLIVTSCNKDDTTPTASSTPQGTWIGTGQYGTSAGNPTYAFTINLKAGGIVAIVGNNNTSTDNATGTWALVADSVKATYQYTSSSAIYKLSGKFSTSSNIMTGTIGLDPVTSGVGIFTVSR